MSGQPRAQQGSEGKVLHAVELAHEPLIKLRHGFKILGPTTVVPRKSINTSIEIKVGKEEF